MNPRAYGTEQAALDVQRFEDEYRGILTDYLATGEESQLLRAHELGKKALAGHQGLLAVMSSHTKALEAILEQRPQGEHRMIVERAEEVLLDCLSAYEMSVRGFWKLQEDMRSKSEAIVRTIFASAQDGVLVFDSNGEPVDFNRAFARMLGFSEKELRHIRLADLTPEDSLMRDREAMRQLRELGWFEEYEKEFVKSDGQRLSAVVSGAVIGGIHEDSPWRAFAFIKDVTEKKRAERELALHRQHLEELVRERTLELQRANERLEREVDERIRKEKELETTASQLRALSARTESIREEERRRISRDVHDKLGQALTGLKMNLALIRRKIEGDAELEDRIDSMSDLIDRTVQTVREISAELRPRLLDDIGLAAALELYLEGFALTTGIKCSLNVTASKIPVNDDAQTALFRIAQEAITNVARHAQASRIDVSFGQKDDLLVLEIRDDGKGIREEDLKSLGILGMKERAHIFGGRVDIEAMSRGGTRVVASIPADPPAEIREGSLPASS